MLRKGEGLLRKLAMLSISRFTISIAHTQQELAQEAQVAMHYVAEICKMDQTVPLIQRLIDLKVDSVDPAVLEKKRKLFVGGVPIDTIVFEQQRVLNVTKDIKKKIQQKGLFCFHPTTIVTTPIFNHLNQFENNKSMIFGPFGISKTISIVLYHQLSSDINRYLYLASDHNRNGFMQNWARKNIKIPKKMIYWSIKLGQGDQKIIQILRRQCLQLNINQSLSTVKSFVKEIIRAYSKKNMPCSVMIDQINNIAEAYRKYNKQILEKKSLTNKAIQESFLASQAEIYSKSIRSIAINCNGTYFYNSPISIQRQLLGGKYKELQSNMLSLDLDYHTDIHRQRIGYSENLRKQVGKQEIDLIIAKQILTRIPTGIITKLWDEQAKMADVQVREQTILKNEIAKARGAEGWQFCVRPLSIYLYISENFSSIKFGSKQELIESIFTIVESLKKESRQTLIKQMQEFLVRNARSQQRQLVASHIYFSGLAKLRESESNSKNHVYISEKQLEQISKKINPLQDLDQELFYQKWCGYEMYFTIEQYTKIMSSKELSTVINSHSSKLIELYFEKPEYRASFGVLLLQMFISYFQNHYKSIVLNLYLDKKTKKTIRFKNMSTFVHFNKSKGTVASHFQKMLQKYKNQEGENQDYVFGVPVDKGEAEQESGTSASIDMLMMRIINITKDDRKIFIYSFDFATAKTADNLQKKLGRNKVSSLIEKAKLQIKEELDALNSPAKESAKESGKDQSPDNDKKKKKQKQVKKVKWDVKQLEWTHYIVISPEMEDDVRKAQYETKQVKNADGSESTIVTIPKYQNKLITFNSFKIIKGDKSPDRSVFEKGVELMNMAK